MPFFLPRGLIDLEYLASDERVTDEAKEYRHDTDFAFFVVNLGLSVEEAKSLTQREQLFLMKAYENKVVFESSLINQAVANAIYNVNRKKGKRAIPLCRKRPKKADTDELEHICNKLSQEKDKSWVEKIWRSNGNMYQLEKIKKRGY